jgi:hypothetical protein
VMVTEKTVSDFNLMLLGDLAVKVHFKFHSVKFNK